MSQVEGPRHVDRLKTVRGAAVHDGAVRHVSGQAVYVDDIPEPPGTLHVAPGLAPIAAGKVTRLDLEPAAAAPDVVAVLTAADVPAGEGGFSPFQRGDMIGFHGQLRFAVVARNRAAARRAASLVRLGTAPAMPLIDVEDAVTANAALAPDQSIHRGDAAMEILRCDRRLSGQFRCGGQDHFALEPQTVLAILGEDRHLTLHAATEDPGAVQRAVAAMLGLPEAAVTVEARRLGGGFGGKGGGAVQWAALAALAAWRTGRPCRLRLERDEEFLATGKRLDYLAEYHAGLTDGGQLRAVDITVAARCGHALDGGDDAVERTLLHADNAYFYPAVRVLGRRLRTDTVPGGGFRGGGAPEGALVAERLMDHIAHSLGADPLDVRKDNFYGPGKDRTPYGMTIDDPALPALVGELERSSDYRRRRAEMASFNQASPILKKGLALTPAKCGVGATAAPRNQAGAFVQLSRDASIKVGFGGVEMGQGLSIKAAQVAAEAFGVGLERVVIAPTNTDIVDTGPGGLDANLMAVIEACRIIKDRLYDFIEEAMHVERERVEFQAGEVLLGARPMPLAALIEAAWTHQVPLSAAGFHATRQIDWDRGRGTGRPFHYFAYGAACAEVTIDIMTGEWRLDRADILQDAGRSLNPAIDIGQIEGGFMLGLGWLTTEDLVWDSAGRLVTLDGSTYAVPRASDLPADFRVELFHSGGNREDTPYRSKDIGDASVMLAISVFSAIADAVGSLRSGVMPRLNAPATPAAIMRAVRSISDGA